MPNDTLQVFILTASALLAAVLLVVMYFAWRGKVVSTHPHCRKCKFNLHGLPDTSHRCPECGTDITLARNRLPVLRKPRRVLAGTLLLGLLFTGYVAATVAVGRLGIDRLYPYLPDRAVVYFAFHGSYDLKLQAELGMRLRARPAAATLIDPLIAHAPSSRENFRRVTMALGNGRPLTLAQQKALANAFLSHTTMTVAAPELRHPLRPSYVEVGLTDPRDTGLDYFDTDITYRVTSDAYSQLWPAGYSAQWPAYKPDGSIWTKFTQPDWHYFAPPVPHLSQGTVITYTATAEVKCVLPDSTELAVRRFTHQVTQKLHAGPAISLAEHQADEPVPFTIKSERIGDAAIRVELDGIRNSKASLLVSGVVIANGQRFPAHTTLASTTSRRPGAVLHFRLPPPLPPTVDFEIFSIPEEFESDPSGRTSWHGYATVKNIPTTTRSNSASDWISYLYSHSPLSPERITSRQLWDLLNTLRKGEEPPELQDTINLLLDVQGDRAHSWDRQVALALELLYLQGKLSDRQWRQYLTQAMEVHETSLSTYTNSERARPSHTLTLIEPRKALGGLTELIDPRFEVIHPTTGEVLGTEHDDPLPRHRRLAGRGITLTGPLPPTLTLRLTGSIRGGGTTIPIDKTWTIPTTKPSTQPSSAPAQP